MKFNYFYYYEISIYFYEENCKRTYVVDYLELSRFFKAIDDDYKGSYLVQSIKGKLRRLHV